MAILWNGFWNFNRWEVRPLKKMASYVRVPAHLLRLPAAFRRGLAKGAERAKVTLENAVKRSIRQRWHKTGAAEAAATGAVEDTTGGNVKIVMRSGTDYDVFGEFGTGETGAQDAPSFKPPNWNYGKLAGMKPRMAFHLGKEEALAEMLEDISSGFDSELKG